MGHCWDFWLMDSKPSSEGEIIYLQGQYNSFFYIKKYQRFENPSHKIDLIVHRTHTNKALGLSLIIQQSNSMMTSILMVCLGKGEQQTFQFFITQSSFVSIWKALCWMGIMDLNQALAWEERGESKKGLDKTFITWLFFATTMLPRPPNLHSEICKWFKISK